MTSHPESSRIHNPSFLRPLNCGLSPAAEDMCNLNLFMRTEQPHLSDALVNTQPYSQPATHTPKFKLSVRHRHRPHLFLHSTRLGDERMIGHLLRQVGKQTVQRKSEDEGSEQARGHSPYGGPVSEARSVFIQTPGSTDWANIRAHVVAPGSKHDVALLRAE